MKKSIFSIEPVEVVETEMKQGCLNSVSNSIFSIEPVEVNEAEIKQGCLNSVSVQEEN